MTSNISAQTVTVTTNYWRVPSVGRAFDGWLEGEPTEEERQKVIEETLATRKAWKPSEEAMQLVEQLKPFVGGRVRIQLWDSAMWMREEDGPFPFDADLAGVVLLEEEGFLQAYLQLDKVTELPNDEGYSPQGYFLRLEDCNYLRTSLADLYSVTKVVNS